MSAIIDRIYEAAFVPDLWPGIIAEIAARAGAEAGTLLVFDGDLRPPRYRTVPRTEEALNFLITSDFWKVSERSPVRLQWPADSFSQFMHIADVLGPERFERDPVQARLRGYGLEHQIATVVPTLTGEVAIFTFERSTRDGRYPPGSLETVNALRPHLARSSLIAARLGLDRAAGIVTALEQLGLPAAVMSARGRVLAANDRLQNSPELFIATAHGGLAVVSRGADRLLRLAVEEIASTGDRAVRSFPVSATEDRPAVVVHAIPLRRAAHDIFSGGDVLVVAAELQLGAQGPPLNLLMGLYDLRPSEARIASALAGGKTLQEAADAAGIRITTARAYLAEIFRKTGTHQQSQLVALLSGVRPS